jgi:hypothetical protein
MAGSIGGGRRNIQCYLPLPVPLSSGGGGREGAQQRPLVLPPQTHFGQDLLMLFLLDGGQVPGDFHADLLDEVVDQRLALFAGFLHAVFVGH